MSHGTLHCTPSTRIVEDGATYFPHMCLQAKNVFKENLQEKNVSFGVIRVKIPIFNIIT